MQKCFLWRKGNNFFSSAIKIEQALHRMKRKQNIKYYLECVRLRGDNNEVQIIMVSKYVGLSLSSNHKSSLHHRIITSIQEQLSRYWWFENSSFDIARKVLRLHAKSMPDLKTFTKVYMYLRIHLQYYQQTIVEFLTLDQISISYSVFIDLTFFLKLYESKSRGFEFVFESSIFNFFDRETFHVVSFLPYSQWAA